MATTRLASVAQLQQRLDASGAGGAFSAEEDAMHGELLDRISQMVNEYCGRHFGLTASQTRTYSAQYPDLLVIPPGEAEIVSITTLKTNTTNGSSFDQTWSTSDYILEPLNAGDMWPARPYYQVRVSTTTASAAYSFPTGYPNSVEIVGTFGWPSVPAIVREICLQETLHAIQSVHAPSGIVASPQLGQALIELQLHPSSRRDLELFRRRWIGAPHGH